MDIMVFPGLPDCSDVNNNGICGGMNSLSAFQFIDVFLQITWLFMFSANRGVGYKKTLNEAIGQSREYILTIYFTDW